MAGRIFDPNNAVFRPMGKLVDILVLSILWTVCSLPVVTLGAATAALYDAAVRGIRWEENGIYARFFATFKANLRVGIPAAVLAELAALLLIGGQRLFHVYAMPDSISGVLYYAYLAVLVVILGAAGYLFPTLSRFEFKVGGLFANCLRLAIAHLPTTLALGVVLTASVWVCLRFLILPLFVVPCAAALISSLLLERIFRPYLDQEKE